MSRPFSYSCNSEDRLRRVMEEVGAREKCLQHSEELLQRFKKATNRYHV